MVKIIAAPNPVLSEIAKQVLKVNKQILSLIKDMEKALLSARDPVGVGLAAPQVGISLQIFLAKPTPKSPILVFINPRIVASSMYQVVSMDKKDKPIHNTKYKLHNTKLEGCLSLPDIWGEVKREPTITLRYQLLTTNSQLITKTKTFSGFMATIIQHETDHLNGILFPKRVLEQKGTLYKSRKNEKGEDIFEEIEI